MDFKEIDIENLKELSPQEESTREDIIVLSLLCEDDVSEAETKIRDLIQLEEETKNNRCLPKIQKIIETTPLKCNGSKVGDTIISGMVEELFPRLEANIKKGLEEVKLEHLQEMVEKLEIMMNNKQVPPEYKGHIAGSLVSILGTINERKIR